MAQATKTMLVVTSDDVHFPKNFALWFNKEAGMVQFGFTDDDGNPLAPLGQLWPTGVNFSLSPIANPGGPVHKDAAGWPIIGGYTKNP